MEYRFYPLLHEILEDTKGLYFLADFIPGGELAAYLKHKLTVEHECIQFFMAEIVIALEQLHDNNIAYRDLKPENIIIDADGHLKIVDFGFAKEIKDGEVTYTSGGTPAYMAPEIVKKGGHDKRADIWALGVLLCDLIGRFTPFNDTSPTKMYENIIHGRIKWPKNMDKISKDLASRMLVIEPNMRIEFKEIKRHLFFSVGFLNVVKNIGYGLEGH